MLEKLSLNVKDYRFRNEDENRLLIYNVRTAEMIFVIGKVKQYIEDLLSTNSADIMLSKPYVDYLVNKNILIKSGDVK